MDKYINRLIKCKYDRASAYKVCVDFIKNLSLFDLECFVTSVEHHVGGV